MVTKLPLPLPAKGRQNGWVKNPDLQMPNAEIPSARDMVGKSRRDRLRGRRNASKPTLAMQPVFIHSIIHSRQHWPGACGRPVLLPSKSTHMQCSLWTDGWMDGYQGACLPACLPTCLSACHACFASVPCPGASLLIPGWLPLNSRGKGRLQKKTLKKAQAAYSDMACLPQSSA